MEGRALKEQIEELAEENGAGPCPVRGVDRGERAMTREDLIRALTEAPDEIRAAEERVLDAAAALWDAKRLLQREEDQQLLHGKIDGKNAEQRAAQLRVLTIELADAVAGREAHLETEKAALRVARDRFSALKAIARVLGGEE